MAVETLPSEKRARVAQADEELLASLGYKQEFKRAFTPFEVFGIAFSIIALLPSIASCLVYSLPYGGPVSMVWGWLAASIMIMFVGLALAELASAAPTSGGLYFWTWTFSPPRYKKVLSWLVGYANTLGSIACVASIDWGCAVQVTAAATIGSGGNFVATTGQTYGIYIAILFTHAVVCSLATEVLARFQSVYVVLNLILFFGVLIALPAATPTEFMNTASFALGDFTNLSTYPAGFAFILSWLAPVWTIGAYDSCVHISEEASNAAVAVPWAIIGAIGISGILGTAMNMAIAFCMGKDLDAIVNSDIGQPLAVIFFNSFGQKATLGIWSVVVLTQWGMGSSIVLATSRQVFAFSRDGAMPFSGILYRMNSYTKTPVNTVWFSVFVSALLGLLAFAGEAAIAAVFSLSVIGLYIAYSIPIGARFLFKGHNYKPGPFNLGAFGLPVAIIAIAFMTFIDIVFLFPTELAPAVADMNYAVVVLGGVMVGCLIWYWFPKYGGVNWFKGPVMTVDVLPQTAHTEDSGSIEREKERLAEGEAQ
ncbi:putative amino-acid permease PB24D3,02c [Schizosaccharomyces pombe 972h-] [Rhizoctonia solani]|uniref:Putative amino-acid permease PB24D3,02c [Schizosaccharomyces pombe 972h-] n=1 Tax=Rhizoctonia solani TaxID=456999 RepID=A0A0K6GBP7_9AGAM|nr:putative amino-acid permease PB24D3,02c [Schizosaccharomyces pombe 972h-] [Rhizoctonia solani]